MLQCASDPCENGATCVEGNNDDDYSCLCLPGFKGKDCEIGETIGL